MKALLSPGVRLLAALRFRGKFGVMAVIVAIPIVTMLALLWSNTQRDVRDAALERRGVEYVAHLVDLLRTVQADGQVFASGAARAELADSAKAMDESVAALARVEGTYGAQLGTVERAQNIADHWSGMRRKGGEMKPEQALAEHAALSEEILDLMYFVAERSRLLLDPEGRSAYLQDVSVSRLPELVAAIGEASGLLQSSTAMQAPGGLAMAYQAALKNQQAAARGLINAFGGSDVEVDDKELAAAKAGYETASQAFLDALAMRVRGQGEGNPAGLAPPALASAYRLNRAALGALDRQIAARAARDRVQQTLLIAGVAGSVLVLAYLLAAFSRSCQEGLRDAMELAARIADGDLSHRIAAHTRDEIGDLVASLNGMSARMGELVSGVKGSSDAVLLSAREVASANADLSARTDRQASSLEEMSASTEELAAAVTQSAGKIVEAGRLVSHVATIVTDSSGSMGHAVSTMDEVAHRSRKVADITGVIDGIAFQTNILALNAAVEAARVGEQGRGFAVVAGEIRALAQRSAVAATEIRKLVEGTVASIGGGAELVKQAGGAIARTVEEMGRVVAMMKDVGTMAREQSASIEQISAVVMEMNGVTQQNAAFVQQTAAIAGHQEENARALVAGVGGFRVGDAPEPAYPADGWNAGEAPAKGAEAAMLRTAPSHRALRLEARA